METPKRYKENLQKNVITPEMLYDCLHSCEQRVKQCETKEFEYRDTIKRKYETNGYFFSRYDNEMIARKKKEEHEEQKTALPSVAVKPLALAMGI